MSLIAAASVFPENLPMILDHGQTLQWSIHSRGIWFESEHGFFNATGSYHSQSDRWWPRDSCEYLYLESILL
jgi:hypothetical protein